MHQDHYGKRRVDSTLKEKVRKTGVMMSNHGKKRYFTLGVLKGTVNSPSCTLQLSAAAAKLL